jgi:hypothetical protein
MPRLVDNVDELFGFQPNAKVAINIGGFCLNRYMMNSAHLFLQQLCAILFTTNWFSDQSDVEKESRLAEIREVLDHFQKTDNGFVSAELVLDSEEKEKAVRDLKLIAHFKV